MAVKFNSFLRSGIHPGCGKVGNLFDSRDRRDCQFTVKSVHGRYTAKLQKCTFLYMLCDFRNLLVSKEHLHYNTVSKVCDRENQNRLFISNLSGFNIHNLSADNDLTHLTGDCFKGNWFAFKISSIDNIRIAVSSESTAEITFFIVFSISKCGLLVFLFLL